MKLRIIASLIIMILAGSITGLDAQEKIKPWKKKKGNSSELTKYTFSNKLAEQEKQLKTNPLMLRFKESRKKLSKDPHRPYYHFTSPENKHNDPNGLCFWKGNFHLFYQGYPPEYPRVHWGHAMSKDLIHWKDLPYAIYPDPEKSCFSGSTYVEKDRVIAMYQGTTVGDMVAVSSDPLLLNWEKVTGKPVISAKDYENKEPYRVLDPCIWKKDDMYYSLSGGTMSNWPGGRLTRAYFLFQSKNLEKWKYLHSFVENDMYARMGDDGSCPYFWPIGNKHTLIHYSHTRGAKYLIGDYDKKRDKFVVTSGGDFNFGPSAPSGVHAPSACPDGKGGVIVIFNMNPGYSTEGWNQIMTLPRLLKLDSQNKLNDFFIEPAGDIESLRYDHKHIEAMDIPPNKEIVLEKIKGNAMEIMAEIDRKSSSMIELDVLRSPGKEEFTRIMFFPKRGNKHREYGRNKAYKKAINSIISIDSSLSSTLQGVKSRAPETAQVLLDNAETLKLRVFIDRSVVEVFVNGKQCVALRVYPGRKDSVGVSLHSRGNNALLISLDAWQMKNIYSSR